MSASAPWTAEVTDDVVDKITQNAGGDNGPQPSATSAGASSDADKSANIASEQPELTPREIVAALDRYIVGQAQAKRAVALALRNRWRRKRVAQPLRDDISPKNIILIGATGVGKTEIARRLAKLAHAPFIKVEASKFTEVGYVGRDVESIVRDLTEAAIHLARTEALAQVQDKARELAEERLLDALLPRAEGTKADVDAPKTESRGREAMRRMLRDGALAGREIEVDVEPRRPTAGPLQLLGGANMEEMQNQGGLQDWMGQLTREMIGKRRRARRVPIDEARRIYTQQEAQKLVDEEAVVQQGVRRAETDGIVFLDEIDKVARREGAQSGPDVSREGVQRDILPIVEGCTVTTKYGPVKTDHVLFIAAGAFHVSKVSDLIPELQGRFPIRVSLDPLGETELRRILQEPQNALPVQYRALLATEGVALEFTEDGLHEMARVAALANTQAENIGARRLHTVLEKILEDVAFDAPDVAPKEVFVDRAYVQGALRELLAHEDLTRYIL